MEMVYPNPDHKQYLAIQHEKEAATALNKIVFRIKVTLNFDATSCSKIDDDWTCLIQGLNYHFALHKLHSEF